MHWVTRTGVSRRVGGIIAPALGLCAHGLVSASSVFFLFCFCFIPQFITRVFFQMDSSCSVLNIMSRFIGMPTLLFCWTARGWFFSSVSYYESTWNMSTLSARSPYTHTCIIIIIYTSLIQYITTFDSRNRVELV